MINNFSNQANITAPDIASNVSTEIKPEVPLKNQFSYFINLKIGS